MYHVFTYDHYYPSGGFGDYQGVFATIEEAREFIKRSNYDFGDICVINPDTGELEMVE